MYPEPLLRLDTQAVPAAGPRRGAGAGGGRLLRAWPGPECHYPWELAAAAALIRPGTAGQACAGEKISLTPG